MLLQGDKLPSVGLAATVGARFSYSEDTDSGPFSNVEFDAVFKWITAGAVNRDGFVIADTAAALPDTIKAEIEKQDNKPEDIDGVFQGESLHRSGKYYQHQASPCQAAGRIFSWVT